MAVRPRVGVLPAVFAAGTDLATTTAWVVAGAHGTTGRQTAAAAAVAAWVTATFRAAYDARTTVG